MAGSNKESTLHNSAFIDHNSSLTPVYHLHGARPDLLDLTEDQVGAMICLVFAREGDSCLLPLAWRYEQPEPSPDDPLRPFRPFCRRALDVETMALAKADLEADGWHVTGRLELYFNGRYSEDNFWHYLQRYLHPVEDS